MSTVEEVIRITDEALKRGIVLLYMDGSLRAMPSDVVRKHPAFMRLVRAHADGIVKWLKLVCEQK